MYPPNGANGSLSKPCENHPPRKAHELIMLSTVPFLTEVRSNFPRETTTPTEKVHTIFVFSSLPQKWANGNKNGFLYMGRKTGNLGF
jgi:hypothetical protein